MLNATTVVKIETNFIDVFMYFCISADGLAYRLYIHVYPNNVAQYYDKYSLKVFCLFLLLWYFCYTLPFYMYCAYSA